MSERNKMRRRYVASSLCLVMIGLGAMLFASCPVYAKKVSKKGSSKPTVMVEPDFAFPKTVEKNADIRLQNALKNHNFEEVLRSAIQLNVASGLVSAENYATSINRYDSLAQILPTPWSNLARLLEARLYCDIYSSKPWIFNNRQLTLTNRPENVMEWSTPMFAQVVSELCERALNPDTVLSNLSIASISGVLEKSEDAQKKGFSVLDFISQQAIELMGRFNSGNDIPLLPLKVSGNADSPVSSGDKVANAFSINSVIESAIARSEAEGNKFKEAYWAGMMMDRLSGEIEMDFVRKYLDTFSDTPYCAGFICAYCDLLPGDNDGRRKQLSLLEDYIAKYPDAEGINEVKNRSAALKRQSVNVSFGSQLLPGKEYKLPVTGENLYNFYILAIALPDKSDKDSYRYSSLKGGRVAASVPVKINGSVPDAFNDTISLPGLASGIYAIVPSRTQSVDGVLDTDPRNYLSVINVSEITAFSVTTEDKKNYFYVVQGFNGKPVEKATVTFYRYIKGTKTKAGTYVTDLDGKFEFENGNYEYLVKVGSNSLSGSVYADYRENRNEQREYRGSLFTDLSLYRPGAEVGVAGVVYSRMGKHLESAPQTDVSIVLRDANWTPIDTIQMFSDKYGRFEGRFKLPETGLTGTWNLNLIKDNKNIGSTQFQVAEYKAPSFIAELNSSSESYLTGDKLTFKGSVKTYSGMPVSGAKVSYTVSWLPGWWRMDSEKASFGGETETDASGCFVINLDTSSLKDTSYTRGLFLISGEVTDRAGETQEFPSIRFSLGSAFTINASFPSSIEKKTDIETYKVSVNDIAGRPVKKNVFYQIVNSGGDIVEKGEFEAPVFSPAINNLPSGKYAFRFSLNADMQDSDENPIRTDSVILWSKSDLRPPVSTCLWVPEKKYIVGPGAKSIEVSVGSSLKEGYVLAITSDSKKYISSDWYKINDGIITVPVEAPADDERIFIEFVAESDLDMKSERVEIIPLGQTEKLEIRTETFRDRIEPGANEKWSFSINLAGKPMAASPVMAVMSDKSLNAIAPFNWNFNPYGSLSWYSPVGVNNFRKYGGSNNYISSFKYLNTPVYFSLPGFNTYGYSLYSGTRYYNGGVKMMSATSGIKIRGSAKMAEVEAEEISSDGMIVNYDSVRDEMASAEAPNMLKETVVTNNMKIEDGVQQEESIEMRDSECPLAFFKPCLVSDNEGNVVVEFTAPGFVGTWQLQLLSYSPDMRGATLKLDAVSSKSVMANLNAPRFVRTGDKVSVAATLYNNTETTLPIGGRLNIINSFNGKEVASKDFIPVDVVPAGSRVVEFEFEVPVNVEALTVRAIAESSSHSDGEQTVVPVLPATTVVRESKTFYMEPSVSETDVKLPEYSGDASVTLNYCGNPVWECLIALPALTTPDSESILVQADALFGNAIASGLLSRFPKLMDGIRAMASVENAADSALFSPLQKNGELKDILLNNTPWVNAAASETLRMQSLIKYTDVDKSKDAVDHAMKLIKDRQNSDGGWSWCPDMKSSIYMTSRVLDILAGLANLGYLPDGAEQCVLKAFGYMDRSIAEQWERSGRKNYSLSELVNYLYAKSAFKQAKNSGAFGSLEKLAMKDLEKDWRELSLFDKATAAMLLEREGNTRLSGVILESICQFASESDEKGMWFDNLKDVWNSAGPLLTTGRVLEAFSMIEPQNPSIDKLRQWIVLSKQTQDWQASRNATEAISALLSSGSDWAVPASDPLITIGGKQIELPRTSTLTGSFTLKLDARTASGSILKIVKDNETPAWGGVVASFVSPIKETKALSMPELKVTKALNVIKAEADGFDVTSGNLKVGDKVRVTITLTCDRDLDYVAVVDNRAACLEPADQLSSYTSSDGVWYYREVRDSKTTLFVPYLSKGTHILSYDCYVDRAGEYSLGIVSAQSQYAPLITASSAGEIICVK